MEPCTLLLRYVCVMHCLLMYHYADDIMFSAPGFQILEYYLSTFSYKLSVICTPYTIIIYICTVNYTYPLLLIINHRARMCIFVNELTKSNSHIYSNTGHDHSLYRHWKQGYWEYYSIHSF